MLVLRSSLPGRTAGLTTGLTNTPLQRGACHLIDLDASLMMMGMMGVSLSRVVTQLLIAVQHFTRILSTAAPLTVRCSSMMSSAVLTVATREEAGCAEDHGTANVSDVVDDIGAHDEPPMAANDLL
jgi:hypothetical protein